MKFFYTGAPSFNSVQADPVKSLGGLVSSSLIQNDILDSIFSDNSKLAVQSLKREAILIAVQNEDAHTAEGVVVSFNVADWTKLTSQYSIAFVAPKVDDCGNVTFDSINDSQSLPFVDMDAMSSTNFSFSLGDIAAGGYIGIWLTKEILSNVNTQPISAEQLYANFLDDVYIDPTTNTAYNPELVPTQEKFSLQINWNEDESGSASG
jgi:hypothetical protein